MFLKFAKEEDRRIYGGSALLELQYCKFPAKTLDRKKVSVRSIDFWDLSSLYIHGKDLEDFVAAYQDLFPAGLYNNMSEGVMDLYGINYYNAEKTGILIDRLKTRKPKAFEVLLQWLMDNPYNNGFYLLGI